MGMGVFLVLGKRDLLTFLCLGGVEGARYLVLLERHARLQHFHIHDAEDVLQLVDVLIEVGHELLVEREAHLLGGYRPCWCWHMRFSFWLVLVLEKLGMQGYLAQALLGVLDAHDRFLGWLRGAVVELARLGCRRCAAIWLHHRRDGVCLLG